MLIFVNWNVISISEILKNVNREAVDFMKIKLKDKTQLVWCVKEGKNLTFITQSIWRDSSPVNCVTALTSIGRLVAASETILFPGDAEED